MAGGGRSKEYCAFIIDGETYAPIAITSEEHEDAGAPTVERAGPVVDRHIQQ